MQLLTDVVVGPPGTIRFKNFKSERKMAEKDLIGQLAKYICRGRRLLEDI